MYAEKQGKRFLTALFESKVPLLVLTWEKDDGDHLLCSGVVVFGTKSRHNQLAQRYDKRATLETCRKSEKLCATKSRVVQKSLDKATKRLVLAWHAADLFHRVSFLAGLLCSGLARLN